jgi:hypothetical protein
MPIVLDAPARQLQDQEVLDEWRDVGGGTRLIITPYSRTL